MCAKPIIGESPFAVVLHDVLIDEVSADLKTENLASMMRRFNDTCFSQVMIEPVPRENVSGYGVVDCGGENLSAGQSCLMTAVVQKTSIEEALLTSLFLAVMDHLQPSGISLLKQPPAL